MSVQRFERRNSQPKPVLLKAGARGRSGQVGSGQLLSERNPHSLVLSLQRTVGNRAVGSVVQRSRSGIINPDKPLERRARKEQTVLQRDEDDKSGSLPGGAGDFMSLITDRRWDEAVRQLDGMGDQPMTNQLQVILRTDLEQIVRSADSLKITRVKDAAEAARVRQLGLDWEEAVQVQPPRWEEAVVLVQAYSDSDLEKKLEKLKTESPEKLHDLQSQASNMSGYERVRDTAARILSAAAPKSATSDEKTSPRSPHEGLVEGNWTDPKFSGLQETHVQSFKNTQLYALFGKVASHMSHELKTCFVGHVMAEQPGGVPNNNFAGLEGDWSPAWAVMLTSDIVPTSKYEQEADKSKYVDWDFKHHNPKFGRIDGHDAGTIDGQLALDPKPSRIALCVRKRRPAFGTAESGAEVMIKNLEKRFEILQASREPKDRDLAEKALAGDAHAYAVIVSHGFTITDAAGKKRSFGAWNGDREYGGKVEDRIAEARTELADEAGPKAEDQ